MKRPLTGLVVAYALGIWIGSLVNWPALWLFCVVAGLLSVFIILHRTQFGILVLLAAVYAAGILGYRHATTISPSIDITRLIEPRDQNVAMKWQKPATQTGNGLNWNCRRYNPTAFGNRPPDASSFSSAHPVNPSGYATVTSSHSPRSCVCPHRCAIPVHSIGGRG